MVLVEPLETGGGARTMSCVGATSEQRKKRGNNTPVEHSKQWSAGERFLLPLRHGAMTVTLAFGHVLSHCGLSVCL